jgi:hypothetical protein
MKKSEAELTKLFEEQVSFIFDEFKKLPHYGQSNPTFIARPKQQDTYEKIRTILSKLNSDVTVGSFNSSGNAHVINFTDESRIVIIYAKTEEDFKWLYNYHSYSNSIIFGKILKSAGLKYSEDGLQYIQYDLRENHKSIAGTINITKDFYQVLEILELNIDDFKNGFKTSTEFIEFVIKSPYFYPDKFINHEKEQRSIILQKLEEYLILNKTENHNLKKLTFDRIKELFTDIDFETEIANLVAKAERKKGIIDKLNGRVILDTIPDFETKKIGIALSYFKHSFPTHEEYIDFMTEHSKEEVMVKFKEVNNIV